MDMKRFLLCLTASVAVGLYGLSPDAHGDEKVKQDKADPAKELAAIMKDWAEAQQAFYKAYGEAKTDEERKKVLKEKQPKPDNYGDRALKLADANPSGPVAIEALGWILGNVPRTPAAQKALPKLKDKLAAIADLAELHRVVTKLPGFGMASLASAVAEKAKKNLDHPKAVPLLVWVGKATLYGGTKETNKLYNGTIDLLVDKFPERGKELAPLPSWLAQDDDPAWAEKHLRRLIEKSSEEAIKSQARFALALVLKNKDEASQPEAENLFNGMADLAATVQGWNGQSLKEEAKSELEDMRKHGLGKLAEVSGADLDGKDFKLSDYKGKVVLLDFWGNW
jgi:hypothetical protein